MTADLSPNKGDDIILAGYQKGNTQLNKTEYPFIDFSFLRPQGLYRFDSLQCEASRLIPNPVRATTYHEMASGLPSSPAAIVPAQVGFLAIFNPSLGHSDATLDDQIVYYSSVDSSSNKRRRSTANVEARRGSVARPTENLPQAERNERLRQIGLAQGMVSFGKNFSGDQSVDTIETEQTRVVLHELEPGWWILAVRGRVMNHARSKWALTLDLTVYRPDTTASSTNLQEAQKRRR